MSFYGKLDKVLDKQCYAYKVELEKVNNDNALLFFFDCIVESKLVMFRHDGKFHLIFPKDCSIHYTHGQKYQHIQIKGDSYDGKSRRIRYHDPKSTVKNSVTVHLGEKFLKYKFKKIYQNRIKIQETIYTDPFKSMYLVFDTKLMERNEILEEIKNNDIIMLEIIKIAKMIAPPPI